MGGGNAGIAGLCWGANRRFCAFLGMVVGSRRVALTNVLRRPNTGCTHELLVLLENDGAEGRILPGAKPFRPLDTELIYNSCVHPQYAHCFLTDCVYGKLPVLMVPQLFDGPPPG